MREESVWGGNQELYAAARLFQIYIVIHLNALCMVIECDALRPLRIIHVAYHGSDHYDSVRSKQDDENADSAPQPIELDCDGFRSHELEQVRVFACHSYAMRRRAHQCIWLLRVAMESARMQY